jgi:predicted permease
VVSNRYWTQTLGSDPAIIGRSLEVKQAPLRVIGVLPPGFTGALRGIAVDLFVPTQTYFGALRAANPNDAHYTQFELIGRLNRGVSLEQARRELDPLLRQVEKDGLSAGPDRQPAVENFAEKGLRSKLESNAVFLATMVLLILIAAANLANLRLVDNEGRRRETGVRLALGASRSALARQHLTETLLLGAIGTAGGLILASWLIRVAAALLYAGKRYVDYGIQLDSRSFAFSSGALLAVSLIGALIPLSDAWKRGIAPVLQGSRITGTSRWLAVLVVAQMAIVTGVTCSAGLLWRSLENIAAIRPAMDPDRKLLLVRGSWQAAPDAAGRAASLAGAISGLPGVAQVAWARRALLSGSGGGAIVAVELPGQPKLSFRYNQVSPGYFAATGARVLGGRSFADSDGPGSTPVVMVNSAFVRRFRNGRQPLGEWVRVGGKDRQIVGVVEDGPTIHLREVIEPYFYFPFAQMPVSGPTFFVETRRDPGSLADSVRSLVRTTDPAFTVTDMVSMGEHMRGARSSEQLAAEVTGGLAGVGLLLAAAGLFGVTLYAVARRTQDFGVRVAMGATPAKLAGQILKEAGGRIALALPLGWALAFAARHALTSMLYGIPADDPWTFLAAGIVVTLVGCAAALHPAIRASRIDPMTALRHE